MTSLSELLREAVADPPAERLDPSALVLAGRRRRRRRRTWVAVAAAAAVVAAVGVPLGVAHLKATPAPASRPQHVLSLDDAVPGVRGRDYTALGRVTLGQLVTAHGRLIAGDTLASGQVLAEEVGAGGKLTGRMALLDPATGRRTWLAAHAAVGQLLGQELSSPGGPEMSGGALIVFGPPTDDNGTATGPYATYDVASRTWRDLPVDRTVQSSGPVGGTVDGGYLYVDLTPTDGVWRVPLTGGAWARVAPGGDAVGVADGVVASVVDQKVTGRLSGAPTAVIVSDLEPGSQRQVAMPADVRRCGSVEAGVSETLIALSLRCGPDSAAVDRVVVLDRRGHELASISGPELQLDSVGRDLVGLTDLPRQRGNGQVGVYTYRPSTGRLARLSRHVVETAPGSDAGNPLRLWLRDDATPAPGTPPTDRTPAYDVVDLP